MCIFFLSVQVEKAGRVEMIEDLIDRDLSTPDLIDKYNIEEKLHRAFIMKIIGYNSSHETSLCQFDNETWEIDFLYREEGSDAKNTGHLNSLTMNSCHSP